jgi:hypothetical protein
MKHFRCDADLASGIFADTSSLAHTARWLRSTQRIRNFSGPRATEGTVRDLWHPEEIKPRSGVEGEVGARVEGLEGHLRRQN